MSKVTDFARAGGRVLGICNGFQVLCETGLLPGVLRANRQQRFICRNAYLAPEVKSSSPTAGLRGHKALRIPIAHGEGAYYADRDSLAEMRNQEQILFRYCDANGQVKDSANPNGSVDNIAGICSPNKRIIGMMPHPERACNAMQDNVDGMQILRSIFNYWENSVQ